MKCHICQGEALDFFVKRKGREKRYYRCSECEYIFIDEGELLNADEEFERYGQHNNSVEDEGYRDYFRRFLEYALEGVERDRRILDYGSGPQPVLASVLAEEGYERVDIYDKYFAPERKIEGKYDIITLTEVAEHIYRPLETFRFLADLLVDGGKLIVMTNFHDNDIEKFSKWWYITDPTHVVFYSLKTMDYIAGLCGLSVEKNNGKNIIVFRKEENEKVNN